MSCKNGRCDVGKRLNNAWDTFAKYTSTQKLAPFLMKKVQELAGGGGPERSQQGKFWLGEEERQGSQDIVSPLQKKIMDALSEAGLIKAGTEGNYEPLQSKISELLSQNIGAQQGFNPGQYEGDLAPYQQALQNSIGQVQQPFNFDTFRQNANQNFQENTLPSIYERFSSLGKGAQTSGAFRGIQGRAASDLDQGLAMQEQQYNMKNRGLDQNALQLFSGLLGQQQGYGIQKGQLSQNNIGLGQQNQNMLQNLLGQQQQYGVNQQNIGLGMLRGGLGPQFENYYHPSTPGALSPVLGGIAKGAATIGSGLL